MPKRSKKKRQSRCDNRSRDSSETSSSSSTSESSDGKYESSRRYRKVKKKSKTGSYTPPALPVSTPHESTPSLPIPVHTYNYSKSFETVNFIPEFDPLKCQINQWIEIIDHNSKTYAWNDNFIIYQAMTKLKGTAQVWYTSFIENEPGWSQFPWNKWKSILQNTFQGARNAYNIFMDIANHRPTIGCSLYQFHFDHLSKINKLRVNFSDADKVSLIIGAINDANITLAVEASGIEDPNLLAAYLKNKYYKAQTPNSEIPNNSTASTSSSSIKENFEHYKYSKIRCNCCGEQGHTNHACQTS